MNGLRWLIATAAVALTTLLPMSANAQSFYVDPYGNVRNSGYYDAWGNYIPNRGPYGLYGPPANYYYGNRYWHNRYRSDWRDIVNGILYNIR